MTIDEFYKLLKEKVKGYSVNGSLAGVLLEEELDQTYQECVKKVKNAN